MKWGINANVIGTKILGKTAPGKIPDWSCIYNPDQDHSGEEQAK